MISKVSIPDVRRHLKAALGTYQGGGVGANIREDGRIFLNGKPFAVVRYFEGLDAPIFRFCDMLVAEHLAQSKKQHTTGDLQLCLSDNSLPGLVLYGDRFTPELRDTVRGLIQDVEFSDKAKVRITYESAVEMQLEFWEPRCAPMWVGELNRRLKDPQIKPSEETRRYPAYWDGKEIFYSIGEDTYKVSVMRRSETRTNGHVDVADNRITMFYFEEGGALQFTKHNSGVSAKVKKQSDAGSKLD